MIDLSLGEFEALVAKALRGVGYSWGLTEDGAYAARRLAECGLAAPAMVCDLTRGVQTHLPSPTQAGPRCPIALGATIADRRVVPDGEISGVLVPALAAPAIALTLHAEDPGGYAICWPEGEVRITSNAITTGGEQPRGPVNIHIHRDQELVVAPIAPHRASISPADFDELSDLASRTYAPATKASRAGAGPAD